MYTYCEDRAETNVSETSELRAKFLFTQLSMSKKNTGLAWVEFMLAARTVRDLRMLVANYWMGYPVSTRYQYQAG